MANYCAGVAKDLVVVRSIGRSDWELRPRIRWPAGASLTTVGAPHALTFNRNFWSKLDTWARNTDWYLQNFPSSEGRKSITWFGEVGSMACHRSTAAHNRARGLDLCHIRFADGSWVDMNHSHRGSGLQQRRYLAVAANLRRHFGTVLTAHYNTAHRDHIHVDNLTYVYPIRTNKRTDITLVQSAANLLDGAGLAIDGIWGSRTEAAYRRLLDRFALGCTDPKSSVGHARLFLSYVVRTAAADSAAGRFRSGACAASDPCAKADDPLDQLECETGDLVAGLG